MPEPSKISPMGVSSNIPTSGSPIPLRYPLTATLVEVPIKVHVPPKIEEKARGISNRDGETLIWRATAITGPKNMAVTVVLFMKAETPPTADIRTKLSRVGCPPNLLESQLPSASKIPVSRMAAPITKMDPSITITSLLNPEKASFTFRIPESTRTHSRPRVTMSTDTFSVAKTTTATSSRPMTR